MAEDNVRVPPAPIAAAPTIAHLQSRAAAYARVGVLLKISLHTIQTRVRRGKSNGDIFGLSRHRITARPFSTRDEEDYRETNSTSNGVWRSKEENPTASRAQNIGKPLTWRGRAGSKEPPARPPPCRGWRQWRGGACRLKLPRRIQRKKEHRSTTPLDRQLSHTKRRAKRRMNKGAKE